MRRNPRVPRLRASGWTQHAGVPVTSVPVQPGDVLRVPEAHYLYGLGALVLRVTKVGCIARLADGDWLAVRGVPRARNGNEGPERDAFVRVAYLLSTQARP